MIIAQISDTHILEPGSNDPAGPVRAEAVRRVIRDINTLSDGLHGRPDLVIHTGDLAQHRTRQEYLFLRDLLGGLNMPYFVIPGNRDDRNLLAEIFPGVEQVEGEEAFVHYSVEDYPIRLIAVDSQGFRSFKGNYSKARLSALRRTLDQNTSQPTALFMHHPPFDITNVMDPFQYESREAVDALEALLSDYSHIVQIFSGHSHRARREILGRIPASTMPSTATDLRKDTYPDHLQDVPVYQVHEWDGEGRFVSSTRIAL